MHQSTLRFTFGEVKEYHMNPGKVFRYALCWIIAGLVAAPLVSFCASASADDKPFKPEELDQMLAPIALYPDPLLAQILIASTYPLEVVQANRWVKQNSNLDQDEINAALDKMDWDPSIKALVPFPDVLSMMNRAARLDPEARGRFPRSAG